MRQSPWKVAPGLIDNFGVEMLPLITAPRPNSTRSRPMISPFTVPLIMTTPTSMKASTVADSAISNVPFDAQHVFESNLAIQLGHGFHASVSRPLLDGHRTARRMQLSRDSPIDRQGPLI